MADAGTINRIGGLLKTTFGPRIVEQQNLTAFTRARYGKADNEFYRAPGSQFQFPARVGGNRGGISSLASDDPLPTASRQQEKQFIQTDRSYAAAIRVYEKDMLNAEKNFQSFISHKEDELSGATRDFLKVINIDLCAGDGSGVLGTINAGAASATQALAVGTGFAQYGSRYITNNDVIDFYDPTLTTSRTGGAGVTVNSVILSNGGGPASAVLSASVTTTTGDIMVRGAGKVNKAYVGLYGVTHNQASTFQGLSTSTNPLLASNRINALGQPLTESLLRSMQSVVEVVAGVSIDEYLAGMAQFDAYEAMSFSQKRFTEMKVDKGFTSLMFGDKKFYKDVDVPSSVIYGVKKDTILFGEVSPMGFGDMDGSVLKWDPGYMAYRAYLREFGNMLYTNPNQLVCCDTLSYPTNNPAYAR